MDVSFGDTIITRMEDSSTTCKLMIEGKVIIIVAWNGERSLHIIFEKRRYTVWKK